MKIKQARDIIDYRLPDFITSVRRFWSHRRWLNGMLLMEACTCVKAESHNDVEKSIMIALHGAILTRNVGQLDEVLDNWNKFRGNTNED